MASPKIPFFPTGAGKMFKELVLQQEADKPDENLLYYGGKPFDYEFGSDYSMTIRSAFRNGFIGLFVPENDQRRTRTTRHLQSYVNLNSGAAKYLKLGPSEELKEGMLVVVASSCQNHDKVEVVRGLIRGFDKERDYVRLFLVDLLEFRSYPRKDLYATTREYFEEPYMSGVAKLEGLEIFTDDPLLNEVVRKHVAAYMGTNVVTRFTRNNLRDCFDVRVKCGDISLNKLIVSEMIASNVRQIPTPMQGKSKGFICHAEENGQVYIQLNKEFADRLTDWLNGDAHALYDKIKNCENNFATTLDNETIYIAPYEGDELFRAKIVNFVHDKATVQFIDYGNFSDVSNADLVPAEAMDHTLAILPELCFGVGLKWIDKIIDMDAFMDCWTEEFEIQVRAEKIGDFHSAILTRPGAPEGDYFNKIMVRKGMATKRTTTTPHK